MKITVSFKTMADTAMMAEQDWAADERLQVEVGFIRQVFNCFDESALELALQLASKLTDRGVCPELTALTIDDHRAEIWLRHLFAVGFDQAVLIRKPAGIDLRFNPGHASRLIAAQVMESGGRNLVLTGSQGGEGDNRQTGPLTAERLGWPCITNVVDVSPADQPGRITVSSLRNGSTLSQTIELPAVLVVGNAALSPCLRQPTLKQRMLARSRPVTIKTPIDLGLDQSAEADNDKVLLNLVRRRDIRRGEMIEGADAAQKARRLYRLHLEGRLAR